jgi:predicted esterase
MSHSTELVWEHFISRLLAFLITGTGTSLNPIAGLLTIARWRVVAVVRAWIAVVVVFCAAETSGPAAMVPSQAPPSTAPSTLSGNPARAPVDYLGIRPAIDGVLDAALRGLPARSFGWASPSAPAGLRPPVWRVAYSARYLYLQLEFEAPQVTVRDRAYQNGDGLVVVLARPRADGAPADEFYVLGVSAGVPAARWQSRFVWYRNLDLSMQALDTAEVATASNGTTASIEFLLPWADVYPYHPWLGDIGFNVCVTRALSGDSRARYCVVEDGRVDSEQSPRRYEQLTFGQPPERAVPDVAAILTSNHIAEGQTTTLRLASWWPSPSRESLSLRVLSGEGTRVQSRTVPVEMPAGLGVRDVDVPATGLPRGGYTVAWSLSDLGASGRTGLTVLAPDDERAMAMRLSKVRDRLAPSSATTLEFAIEELGGQRARLKPYDVATSLRLSQDRLVADLASAESGSDPVASRTGVIRRAYRSALDGTLRPYSVRLPADYRPGAPRPLFVYLHGSGEDDRNQLDRAWLPADMIVLAPNGRGTSNWYTSDGAQDDIREAIDDVVTNYAVDTTRIVLAGFSMGGYGVYRTFLANPGRYRALAIFSGLPYVPGRPADAPDLLNPGVDVSMFDRVPIFVFHGGKDRNCPIEDTRAVVEKLERRGARVEFRVEADKGHEAAGEETLGAFSVWLRSVLAPVRRPRRA